MEEKVCLFLKGWFEKSNICCWINQGEGAFTTKGSRKKPDLVIFSKKTNQYIAIEVKVGNSSKDVHDANKIIDYWKEYTDKKIKYFVDDKEIIIFSFAVATFFSPFGKIFKEDIELNGMEEASKNWKKTNFKCGAEPLYEYRRSRDYLRSLWANWRRIRKSEESAGMGIILSDILNKTPFVEGMDVPLLFDQQREFKKGGLGRQWKVRQKIL